MPDTYDLVVIGLGPGGEALATGAAQAGLRVLAVDKHLVGGECPYYGCIPSKMMVRAADTLAEAGRAAVLAGDVSVTASWEPVARRVSEEATAGWDDTIAVRRLEDAGARSSTASPGSTDPVGSPSRCPTARRAPSSRSAASCSTRARAPPLRRSRGSTRRRTGPTATPCAPTPCRARWSCSAADRSAASWPRCSPGSGYGSRSCNTVIGSCRPASRRRRRSCRTSWSARASAS